MIRQFIPEEYCLKCLGCCRFKEPRGIWSPTLWAQDIEGLLNNKVPPFFILDNQKLRFRYNQKEDNYACSLLELETNRCRAYAFRPLECQLYPFLLDRSDQKVFLSLDLKCPFVQGKQPSEIFREYTQYLDGFFSQPQLLKHLKENPQLIQEYPGAQNLVLLEI